MILPPYDKPWPRPCIAADLILISGGSSVGVRDLTLTAIQDLPGSEILVHGVALRPGKPTILAALGRTPA